MSAEPHVIVVHVESTRTASNATFTLTYDRGAIAQSNPRHELHFLTPSLWMRSAHGMRKAACDSTCCKIFQTPTNTHSLRCTPTPAQQSNFTVTSLITKRGQTSNPSTGSSANPFPNTLASCTRQLRLGRSFRLRCMSCVVDQTLKLDDKMTSTCTHCLSRRAILLRRLPTGRGSQACQTAETQPHCLPP